MNRLAACFDRLRHSGQVALVPYLAAADPRPQDTVELMHVLVENGADIVELGVPFSDPMADGPVIQAACIRALAHGVTLKDVLEMVEEFRRRDTRTPVVLMGYSNPVEVLGPRRFVALAKRAGVDGVITVDLPPEEAQAMGLIDDFEHSGIAPIFLLAPTTSQKRIERICASARGFIYYVSLKGVTGAGHFDGVAVARQVARIRRFTELPVAVGFGIKNASSAAAVAGFADAVVVGSALVEVIAHSAVSGDCFGRVAAFLRPIRAVLDEAACQKQSVFQKQ